MNESVVNMNKRLKILMLEDSADDAGLIQHQLKRSGLDFVTKMVETKDDFEKAIKIFKPDIILSDHSMPNFNSTQALKLYRELNCRIPFILVTGAVSEEFAVQTIKDGAADYLLKNNLTRLSSAVTNALKNYETEKEKAEVVNKIREQNIFMSLMMESLPIAYYSTRSSSEIWASFVSYNIFSITGYCPNQFTEDAGFWRNRIHPEDTPNVHEIISNLFEKKEYVLEYRLKIADGTYHWFYDRLRLVKDAGGNEFFAGALIDITDRKKLEQELTEKQLYQQKLITETTIEAQENERNMLGKELHDNINQILATVKMYIGIVKMKENEHQYLINDSYRYLDEAMEAIRILSQTLVSPSLGDISFKDAIQELVEEFNIIKDLHIQLVYEVSEETYINEKMGLMFYRIVQEQLNNIRKYAKATKVVISISAENKMLFLSISDNGVGFDPDKKAKGIGLKNIKSRVDFYSGEMKIIAAPGKGCTLQINIPLNDKPYA